ncbi:MAG TPA: P-II family nitrogen regulator [Syntrophorhabdaceae bacterium]|jgi:nitrogen regulatory protein PII
MKEIVAILQPFMLGKVAWALQNIPAFPGMTVTKVQGFGRGRAKGAPHTFVEDLIEYVAKVKIEVIANDDQVEEILSAIIRTAHTGHKGDGKIFVLPVERTVRIRTGDFDEAAV